MSDTGDLVRGTGPVPAEEEPLVLLPGTLCDGRVWEPLMRRLPEWRSLAMPFPDAETTPDAAARILGGAPPRFALAGFSLGGIVALEMIAQAPGRITRLALLDTTARPDPPENWTARRNAVARGVERYVSQKLWSLYVSGDHQGDEEKRALVAAMSGALGLEAFRTQSEIAIHRADSRPRLSAIQVPTLVLCGEADRLCSLEVHREMADLIPGARLAVVPGSGHFALIEQPDRVADEMRRWLDASLTTLATPGAAAAACPDQRRRLA